MAKISKAEQHDPELHMEMETLRGRMAEERQKETKQTEREQMIAQFYEVVGRIQGAKMVSEFGNVAGLLWIKQIRETKAYREIPSIGTWDKFCDSIGLSRRKVEEDLENLAVFGEAFTATVAAFGVGYRDLRKLRQLTHDGSVIIDGECLVISDEEPIPINEEHADEIQAAIERIISAKKDIEKRVSRLEKDFNGAIKEEVKSYESKEKALLERVKTLEQYEPSAHDETWCEDQMQAIREQNTATCALISGFIVDPRLDGDRAAQAAVLEQLSKAEMMLRDLRARFETAYSIGD